MSKIHILNSDNNFSYKIVIHSPTPAGVNAVGLTWKSCALSNGDIGSTVLEVGTEPGNITQAEHDSIIAGDTIEIIATISPGLSPINAVVDALANQCIDAWTANLARVLKYYGHKIEV